MIQKVKYIILFSLLLLGFNHAHAQSAVVSMGGDIVSDKGSVSFTVGQPADMAAYDTALTVNTRTAAISEGVQQPYFEWELLNIPAIAPLQAQVVLYPNPTVDVFEIQVQDLDAPLTYELYTINGQRLQKGTMRNLQKIKMSGYATGTYMLKLATEDRQYENRYKIIKAH